MSQQTGRRRNRLLPATLIGGGTVYLLQNYTGPLVVGAYINPVAILPALFLTMSIAAVGEDFFWWLGTHFDLKAANTATGQKGTARFVESLDEIRHELIEEGWGPYWGTFKGNEIMSPVGSNSTILGTTGSGKGVGMVQMNGLTIHGSKLFSDFKSENACILARTLRERGEQVRILNLGNINTDILGESDYYNPLVLIADGYLRPDGLMDISADVHEFNLVLNPEPVGEVSEDGDKYFRDGSRNLAGFAIQMCVLLKGHDATLGEVTSMLKDKNALLKHAQWACGRLERAQDDGVVH